MAFFRYLALVLLCLVVGVGSGCDGRPVEPAREMELPPPPQGAEHILFLRDHPYPARIYLGQTDGTGERMLTGDWRLSIKVYDWSPQTGLLAYVRWDSAGVRVTDLRGNSYGIIDPGTRAADIRDVRWSPDGRDLLFQYEVSHQQGAIHTARVGRTGTRRIAAELNMNTRPVWTPDGSEVAFGRMGGGPEFRHEFYLARADGSGERKLSLPVSAVGIDFSPDGHRITFLDGRIWVANADGTDARVLAGRCGRGVACATSETYQLGRWSPDGREIVTDRGGRVIILQADGSGEIEVQVPTSADPDPRWSLDGSRIVFVGGHDNGPADILTVGRDGTDLVRVTSTPGHEWAPRWVRMP